MHQELSELLRLLENPGPLSADLNAALAEVQNSLQTHLFHRLKSATDGEKLWAQSNPPREAALLRALGPFAGGNARQIDRAAEALTLLTAWQSLQKDLREARQAQSPRRAANRSGERASLTMSEDGQAPYPAPQNPQPDWAQLLLALSFFDKL